MTTAILQQLETQDLAMRRLFVDALSGEEYQSAGIEADIFHETLALTQRRNWVHPTQLAHRMSASSSNVRKWFLVKRSDEQKRGSR